MLQNYENWVGGPNQINKSMRQISEIDLSQVTRNPPRDGAEIGGGHEATPIEFAGCDGRAGLSPGWPWGILNQQTPLMAL